MARRNRSTYGDFGREFAATYGAFGKVADDVRNARIRGEIGAVDGDYAPRQTETASGEDALAAGNAAKQAALQNAISEEDIAKVDSNYKPTIDALEAQRSTPAGIVQSMGTGAGYRMQAEPFSENDVQSGKASARAEIYGRSGREEDAARVLLNESRRRTLADDAELRTVMRPEAQPSRLAVAQEGTAKPINAEQDRVAADAYLQRKAPQVINTLLQQGNLEGAKKYRDFIDSEAGRNYTTEWAKGTRKLMVGDHQGALNQWQTLYNQQLYADGNTVALSSVADGKQVRADFFDKDGKPVNSVTKPLDDFARQAGMALAPEKAVEFQAQQEAKRASEAGTLDRQTQLEELRQQGRDKQDDRRDERLGRRLDAQGAALDRRLAAQADRGLTTAQEAKNSAIDAARVQLQGMSPEDVSRKTQSALASGRVNPEYDAGLARAAKLATTRKIGDDQEHDAFSQGKAQQNAQANQRADVAKRFRSDPAMSNHTLGRETPNGVEVLSKGRLIGYFR